MGQDPSKIVNIRYMNWKGDIGTRRIEPLQTWFGSTEWHPEPQWFLKAFDHDKQEWRDFAMRDILKFDISTSESKV